MANSLRKIVRQRRKRRQRIIAIIALIILIAAWVYGYTATGAAVEPSLPEVIPESTHYQKRGNIFIAHNAEGEIVGYAATAQSTGYGGPVKMLVGVDPQGAITGVKVIDQKETPGFFRLLPQNRYFHQFLRKDYHNTFTLGHEIDAASGATLSSEAVASAIRDSVREIATSELNKDLPPLSRSIQFGLPEATLIGLYTAGFFAHRMKDKTWQNRIRWVTLISGLIILGFIYNKPLTLANFISFLAGFWPNWHTHIYWYLLLGGILFVTTAQAKNPYCHWFCPFGSAQEVLSSLTDAKTYRPRKYHRFFSWLQRGLAYAALALGLAFRLPGAASPEPFGTLFNLTGSWPQYAVLIAVLFASLLIYRPFCHYLCPLKPVVDFIGEIRRWIQDIWKNKIKSRVT